MSFFSDKWMRRYRGELPSSSIEHLCHQTKWRLPVFLPREHLSSPTLWRLCMAFPSLSLGSNQVEDWVALDLFSQHLSIYTCLTVASGIKCLLWSNAQSICFLLYIINTYVLWYSYVIDSSCEHYNKISRYSILLLWSYC